MLSSPAGPTPLPPGLGTEALSGESLESRQETANHVVRQCCQGQRAPREHAPIPIPGTHESDTLPGKLDFGDPIKVPGGGLTLIP